MLKAAYSFIFRKIKEIRGSTLDDDPSTFLEIMKVFDEFQKTKTHGLQIAEQLINETTLCLSVIESIGGKDCPKFMVASNKIAFNSLKLITEMVDIACAKALLDILPEKKVELWMQINALRKMLYLISDYYMIPEVQGIYKEIITKLATAKEYLKPVVAII